MPILGLHASVPKLHDPVRAGGDLRIVSHHHDCQASLVALRKQVQDRGASHCVEVASGLVGQKHSGVSHQRTGNRSALALSAGELRGPVMQAMPEPE